MQLVLPKGLWHVASVQPSLRSEYFGDFWTFFEFVWLWILSLETERVEWFKYYVCLIPIHCRTGRCQWIDHLLGRFGCHCLRVEFFEFRKRAFLGTSHLAENQVYLKLENVFGQWDEAPAKETEQMSEMMRLRMFMRPSRWALLCPALDCFGMPGRTLHQIHNQPNSWCAAPQFLRDSADL